MRKDIAAHTAVDNSTYPAFVSIHDHGEEVVITLRYKQVRNDVKGRNDPGPIAGMKMSWAEFDKFVADIGGYKRSA